MSLYALLSALEIGMIFSFVALGIFLTFRVLDFPDLTVDGSFPLGAAVSTTLIQTGWNPWISLGVGVSAGICAGLCTAWLYNRLKVFHILASIVTMTALYSLNIRIMGGQPNIALLDPDTIFSRSEALFHLPTLWTPLLLSTVLLLGIGGGLAWFLRTEMGLAFRASGDNPAMARALGISTAAMTALGLGLSNGLVAFAGGLYAQVQGSADVGMGIGTAIAGLASVIIGEALWPTRRMGIRLLRVCIGSLLYRVLIAVALSFDTGTAWYAFRATDLNLVTAGLVILSLLLSPRKKGAL